MRLRPLMLGLALGTALPAQERPAQLRPTEPAPPGQVSFLADVRPILSDKCFACHGPDAQARKADLRLDSREAMLLPREAGAVLVPGKPEASLLLKMVLHPDPRKRMPPARHHDPLTPAQVTALRRWIQAGAPWQRHWSLTPLPRAEARAEAAAAAARVDALLAQQQAKLELEPAPPADPRVLVRRLYLDLLGLPPEPEDVAAFVADPSPARYRQLVEKLLHSAHHAERLTMYWLDLVRYADSCGIHGDQPVSMSPYRDWVIQAFRENMPFDRFTREQLAGDLIEGATLSQRVASGYNRLNMKTAEGGAQPEEYLAKYAADRVRTTATVWLGSTLGCAECHDHKFDPFTTRDFYRFAAFFADLEHKGFYPGANWTQKVAVPTPTQAVELAELDRRIDAAEAALAAETPALTRAQAAWEIRQARAMREWLPPELGPWWHSGPYPAASLRDAYRRAFAPETRPAGWQPEGAERWTERQDWEDGKVITLDGENCANYLWRRIEVTRKQVVRVSLGSDDSIKVWLDGKPVLANFVSRGVRPDQEQLALKLSPGSHTLLCKISNGGGGHGFYFRVDPEGPPAALRSILILPESARSASQLQALRDGFRRVTPLLQTQRDTLAALHKERSSLQAQMTTSLVSVAREVPRQTRILRRGDWQDKGGELVRPGVPAFLPGADQNRRSLGRLDLAAWITAKENPLTARTMVNRLWKLCFGAGLSKTLDDLGSQGDWPRQLPVLNWLAAEFQRDWDLRRILRIILLTRAYQRTSTASAAARQLDPDNRYFARQNRFRHDAEVVRDLALAHSALLNPTVGGPSVKPYQPAGYWRELNFPKRKWVADTGPEQYRRGMYTHWQRTFLHPSMRAFDAPSREECTAERARSNTPLQALVLLNDPSFVEAARVLAARCLREGGKSSLERLEWLFAEVLQRRPSDREQELLSGLLQRQQQRYAGDGAAARELLSVGQAPRDPELPLAEHAAWVAVTRSLLNLHETLVRY